jgi:Uma2 family endonuclease
MPTSAQIVMPSARSELSLDRLLPLTVEQYHEMVRAGILSDDDPVELLEGLLVKKMPKNPPHRAVTRGATKLLESLYPSGFYVDSQAPITLASSEPEPDVLVVRGASEQFKERHPGPADLVLVVEVSDSSLQQDRVAKKMVYAGAGISVYWIINLVDRQVEVFTEPTGATESPDYRVAHIYKAGDRVPVSIDQRSIGAIDVKKLLT